MAAGLRFFHCLTLLLCMETVLRRQQLIYAPASGSVLFLPRPTTYETSLRIRSAQTSADINNYDETVCITKFSKLALYLLHIWLQV